MSPLKLAFAGCGDVAESYLQELHRMQRAGLAVELAMVCGSSRERARTFIDRLALQSIPGEFGDALSSDAVDAIVILSPMPEHDTMTQAALTAGKHVFCEKTLASSSANGKKLADLAAGRRLLLCSAPATPLNPVIAAMRQHIRSGAIGRAYLARSIYGWAGPDWSEWFYASDAGPLRDLGCYGLTTLTALLGPVREVWATGLNAEPSRMINGHALATPELDTYQLMLTFANGAMASLTTGFSLQKHDSPGLEVFGDKGTLQIEGQDWEARGYRIWANSEGCWRSYAASRPWTWTDGLRDFCESIIHERKPALDISQVLHVLDVIDAAVTSCRSGEKEKVESSFIQPHIVDLDPHAQPHRIHKSLK
jgi:predicted dehydrogenase